MVAREDLAILDTVENSQAKELQRNTEAQVAFPELGLKIDRSQVCCRTSVCLAGRKDVRASHDGEELMYAAVRSSIRVSREANLAYRSVLLDERRNGIGRPFAMWNQIEHRILRLALQAHRILRVRYHEAT